ncbi:MAG: hypothetical protein R3B70_05210 [Polyangiaceae bacterium]
MSLARAVPLVALFAFASLGCHLSHVPLLGHECREVKDPAAPPPVAPGPPPPAHADFHRLLAYRNYYAISAVTEYEHHFGVWFSCIEQSVQFYAVSPSGKVRSVRGYWGGLATSPEKLDPIPPEQRDNELAVLAAHRRAYDGDSSVRVGYLGSYREIHVQERVPEGPPGDPYSTMMAHSEAVLRANGDLTAVSGFSLATSGDTRLCWRDLHVRECTEQEWFDFTPEKKGLAQLHAFLQERPDISAAERARFQDTVLAAARRHAEGKPGVPLDDILAHQGDSLLPPGLVQPIRMQLALYARPSAQATSVKQEEIVLQLDVPARDALTGVARAEARGEVAGIPFKAEVELAAVTPQDLPASGAVEAPLEARFVLTDGRGNKRTGTVPFTAGVLVDGESLVLRSIAVSPSLTDGAPHAPLHHTFAGSGPFQQIDVYFQMPTPTAVMTWSP